jgi:hypothetical protein
MKYYFEKRQKEQKTMPGSERDVERKISLIKK